QQPASAQPVAAQSNPAQSVSTQPNPAQSAQNPAKRLVDVIFHPEINEYNGQKKIQLIVRSVRLAV
ncbi:MAG: hypothetical protein LBU58_09075, partial [Clostridiales bacterium]|nr:hypothetical protein [Clostridiales bacterium]